MVKKNNNISELFEYNIFLNLNTNRVLASLDQKFKNGHNPPFLKKEKEMFNFFLNVINLHLTYLKTNFIKKVLTMLCLKLQHTISLFYKL